MISDANWCAVMGLKHLCYEGGAIEGGGISDGLRTQADGDPRMRANYVEHHRAFNRVGGELLMYFNSTSGGTPGLSLLTHIEDLTAPKYLGILDVGNSAPEPITHGRMAPFTIPGATFETMMGEGAQEHDWATHIGANGTPMGYVFRVEQEGIYGIEFEYSTATNSRMGVDLQGRELAVLDMPSTGGATRVTSRIEITCEPGTRYGMRLVGYEGLVVVSHISVSAVSLNAGVPAASTAGARIRASSAHHGQTIRVTGLRPRSNAVISLITMDGKVVRRMAAGSSDGACLVSTKGLAPGAVVVRVTDERGTAESTALVR
jgi:hypothetical protein